MTRAIARVALVSALGLLQVISTPSVPVARETNNSQCWRVKDTERSFYRRMNRARERNGVGRMRLDPELSKAARSHTHGMVKKEELYHTPGERLSRKITNWSILGENVGVGANVAELHRAFMDSAGHRDNVLYKPYTYVGVGVVMDKGRMWVSMVFESRTDPGTTQRMPSC